VKHSKGNNRILTLVFLGVLISALDISVVEPAIPGILKYALHIETGTEMRAAVLGILMIMVEVGELSGAALIGAIISGSKIGPAWFGNYGYLHAGNGWI